MSIRNSSFGASLFVLLTILLIWCPSATGQSNQYGTAKIEINNRTYVGYPMAHDGQKLALLRRDGRLTTLPVSKTSHIKTISENFRPYSREKIRQSLQKEFGTKYQVSVTQNFVVVHPRGNFKTWALPFEQLFLRFNSYFTSRGLELNRPQFPMVAIVLRTRGEFDRFLKTYHQYNRNVLGYYSPRSNRIITYAPSKEKSKSKSKSTEWGFQETLIHEATHQTAYNTGIHSRFAPVPRWIPEGLAMMFEAKGVNDSQHYPARKDRVNRARLSELKRLYKQGKVKGKISNLVSSDNLFRSDTETAYAIAWGLTFFLAERYPSQYFDFLKHDAKRPEFQTYSPKQRVRAFAKKFGADERGLEKQLKRFVESL